MENADLEKFRERIRNEANLFYNKDISQKGFEDGQNDAFQWSYAYFMRYANTFEEKKNLSNFTIEEIEELYSFSKSRQSATRVIRIERIEGGEGFEGAYRIIEERNDDPLEDTSDAERAEYLKGSLRGIQNVWIIALHAMR